MKERNVILNLWSISCSGAVQVLFSHLQLFEKCTLCLNLPPYQAWHFRAPQPHLCLHTLRHLPLSLHPRFSLPRRKLNMGGGGKIPYPKHVWSPAGGWYAQPHNWKANTAVAALVIVGITGCAWKLSAEREVRYKMPEKDQFFPSR